MRFGCCVGFSGSEEDLGRVAALAEMGYQYIEPPVSALLVEGELEDYYAVRRALRRAALTPEAFNCFIPSDLKLVGDEVDWQRIERFVATALERVEEVGGRTVVFGSGHARWVPEGFPKEEALSQLRYFLSIAADYAGPLVVAVEPLGPTSGNILNNLEEVATLVAEVGRPEIRVAVDSLEMDAAGEGWDAIRRVAHQLAHARCCDRGHQRPGLGGADLGGFFAALNEAGYHGRVSLNCPWADFGAEAEAALQSMKQLAEKKR